VPGTAGSRVTGGTLRRPLPAEAVMIMLPAEAVMIMLPAEAVMTLRS
jgi:hypothetical protein